MTVPSELRGAVDGPAVQQLWPGRLCDTCRATQAEPKSLATHARDTLGGGRDFFCDPHLPAQEAA